jgi:hypothetical protein
MYMFLQNNRAVSPIGCLYCRKTLSAERYAGINCSSSYALTGYCFTMATTRVHKRNATFVDLADLVEELGNIGLGDTIKKYYNIYYLNTTPRVCCWSELYAISKQAIQNPDCAADIS